jgi:RNA polymerase sigma-70 factor (ECF subfamily)
MNSSVTIRLPGLSVAAEQEDRLLSPSQSAEAEVSDEALFAEVCVGSREALGVLFRRYCRCVRGVAYRVLRDPSEADDLLQDIFLLVHRLCKTFDGSKAPVRFWILQMTYRRAISRRRYLNSRHFYTRVDLNELGTELGGSTDLGGRNRRRHRCNERQWRPAKGV